MTSIRINEIYLSLQGESTWAGLPCVFVRLSGCNLRCSYCDSAYAFYGGESLGIDEILARVRAMARPYAPRAGLRLPLVELTGGEPLLQSGALGLMSSLCDEGFTVLVETSGAVDIGLVDPRVHRIMDLKCPSSGEVTKNRWENLDRLRSTDEVKFVISSREDYLWMKGVIEQHALSRLCPILVSWASPLLPNQQDPALCPVPADHELVTRQWLAEQVVADALPVRFQLQIHKFIWPPDQRGV